MKKSIAYFSLLLVSVLLLAATVDLNNPFNYSSQTIVPYITKDNTPANNSITDLGATLGRVLFYDENMSLNNTIACASCHIQAFAFGDTAELSVGFEGGLTGRHSMRLINARFGDEVQFFWDERASSLEEQTTLPIQDHVEMGFSGTNGNPDFDSLVRKLETISYYSPLFTAAFGDNTISEARIQFALAQFVRSIQSFDAKFDIGRNQVNNDIDPFPNYTASENNGKLLFLNPTPLGGAGCAGCHRAPEFDIDPATLNNGIIGVAGTLNNIDLTNTRAPSLRDIVNPNGDLNGPLMHNGGITSLEALVEHYNLIDIDPLNTNLDPRLGGPGGNLQLTTTEKEDLINFLKTLTGMAVYSDEKWSDPFDENGDIDVVPMLTAHVYSEENKQHLLIYPNPAQDVLHLKGIGENVTIKIFDTSGKLVLIETDLQGNSINIQKLKSGVYHLQVAGVVAQYSKFIKQ
jgi:cytochrome c peroxidase